MALPTASDNEFPKVILEEVANDGSATVTPAADHRALFLGEDGGLHLKDSAAAVTDVGGDAAAHIADATDAHDASAISVLDTAANFTGTDVEAVLAELQDNIDGVGGGSTVVGRVLTAGPMGMDFTASFGTGGGPMAAVSGGNAGAIAFPIYVPGPMYLQAFRVLSSDTGSTRTAEARLYIDNGDSTADFVTGTDAAFSFTGAVAVFDATVSGAPVLLDPGTYWAVLRNTSASTTFGYRRTAASQAVFYHYQTATIPALGSSIELDSGWTAILNGTPGLWISGRVVGKTTVLG